MHKLKYINMISFNVYIKNMIMINQFFLINFVSLLTFLSYKYTFFFQVNRVIILHHFISFSFSLSLSLSLFLSLFLSLSRSFSFTFSSPLSPLSLSPLSLTPLALLVPLQFFNLSVHFHPPGHHFYSFLHLRDIAVVYPLN